MTNIIERIKKYYRPFFVNRNWIKFSIYSCIVVLLILFDVLTKIGVFNLFASELGIENIKLVNSSNHTAAFGLIRIRLSFNTGAAFSFLSTSEFGLYFLPLLSLIMFLVILYFYVVYFDKVPEFVILALVLILAGCFGNMVDRFGRVANNPLYFRGVIDFIDVSHIFTFFNAIFNIADVCVVASFVTILLGLIHFGINTLLHKKYLENEQPV